jgi:hypothetical protein
MEGILIPIIAIICIFALPVIAGAYVLIKLIGSNNKERMELAKHGIIPPVRQKPSPNKYRSLRNGVLCIGIAIGLILGIVIITGQFFDFYIEFLIITSSTVLCLGLAYVIFYFMVKNKDLDNNIE